MSGLLTLSTYLSLLRHSVPYFGNLVVRNSEPSQFKKKKKKKKTDAFLETYRYGFELYLNSKSDCGRLKR